MFFFNPEPTAVRGRLLDANRTGFRVKHDCMTLNPGLEISYCRDGEMGHARVVWTMIAGSHRISGVMIYRTEMALFVSESAEMSHGGISRTSIQSG